MPQILPFDFGDEPVNAGDTSAVQCTITKGDSPIHISWIFRDRIIQTSTGGVTISQINKRISTLSIESVAENHSGEYTCCARNTAGEANHTAHLYVNGASSDSY